MTDTALDNLNYYNDPRVRNAGREEVRIFDDAGEEIELPTHWEVCPTCEGKGTHVNPSIDAGGLSPELIHDDPEFMADYMDGVYDVVCATCNGRSTVQEVHWAKLTDDQREAYEQRQELDADYHAERMAEIRMGA